MVTDQFAYLPCHIEVPGQSEECKTKWHPTDRNKYFIGEKKTEQCDFTPEMPKEIIKVNNGLMSHSMFRFHH